MKWHCGLLSNQPERDRTLQWIKRGQWDTLPEDVQHELRVWMAMSGFHANYHALAFGLDKRYVAKFMGGYRDLKKEVGENWLSATRGDCIALCHMRGRGDIPVICQIQMTNDVKAGYTQAEVSRIYGVNSSTMKHLSIGRIKFRGDLPDGFALLGGRTNPTPFGEIY